MDFERFLDWVACDIVRHCRQSKGHEESPLVNPLVPPDCVAVFILAKRLTDQAVYDYCVAVAPEGHGAGYFFEKLGARVLSVQVDYPPRRIEVLDDLAVLRGGRVLVLEDDVISGTTLRLVVGVLNEYRPRSLALFLTRPKESQQLQNVPPEFETVYLPDDTLNETERKQYQSTFASFFERRGDCGGSFTTS